MGSEYYFIIAIVLAIIFLMIVSISITISHFNIEEVNPMNVVGYGIRNYINIIFITSWLIFFIILFLLIIIYALGGFDKNMTKNKYSGTLFITFLSLSIISIIILFICLACVIITIKSFEMKELNSQNDEKYRNIFHASIIGAIFAFLSSILLIVSLFSLSKRNIKPNTKIYGNKFYSNEPVIINETSDTKSSTYLGFI